MIGAKMMLTGNWKRARACSTWKQFDPDPFMDDLNHYGLPWQVVEL